MTSCVEWGWGFTDQHRTLTKKNDAIQLIMCMDRLYFEVSSTLLFVPVGLGAGAIVVICIAPIVFTTVVALLIYKKYYQRGTTVVQISKQTDM